MVAASYVDHFGYLPLAETIDFGEGTFEPVDTLSMLAAEVESWRHVDGHVYPTLQWRVRYDPTTAEEGEKMPRTERPAHLSRLPCSHRIVVQRCAADRESARYGDAGFLVHLLGFLCGMRCQFYDWWIDGRYRPEVDTDHTVPRVDVLGALIGRMYDRWHGFVAQQQLIAINALFLHSRTQVYENEWELFQAEYQVFDAVFSVARDTGQVSGTGGHPNRIRAICDQYGIPFDQDKVKLLVNLRNNLIHQALWDDRMPGEARSSNSLRASWWLHNLTRRAMLSVLGISGPYVQSIWWGLGRIPFAVI